MLHAHCGHSEDVGSVCELLLKIKLKRRQVVRDKEQVCQSFVV